MIAIKDAEREIRAVAVRSERYIGEGTKVVHEVKRGLFRGLVVAGHYEVDEVWGLTESLCHLVTSIAGGGSWRE